MRLHLYSSRPAWSLILSVVMVTNAHLQEVCVHKVTAVAVPPPMSLPLLAAAATAATARGCLLLHPCPAPAPALPLLRLLLRSRGQPFISSPVRRSRLRVQMSTCSTLAIHQLRIAAHETSVFSIFKLLIARCSFHAPPPCSWLFFPFDILPTDDHSNNPRKHSVRSRI